MSRGVRVEPGVAVCAQCGGKNNLRACGGCRTVSYCCVDCQKKHRAQHRAACRKQQALQASAGAATSDLPCTRQLGAPPPARRAQLTVDDSSKTTIADMPRSVVVHILHFLLPEGVVTCQAHSPHGTSTGQVRMQSGNAFMPDKPPPAFPSTAGLARLQARSMRPKYEPLASPHARAWSRMRRDTCELLSAARVCRLWRDVVREDTVIRSAAITSRALNIPAAARDFRKAGAGASDERWAFELLEHRALPPVPVPSLCLEDMLFVNTAFVPFGGPFAGAFSLLCGQCQVCVCSCY